MKIAVYLGSSYGSQRIFVDGAKQLGRLIGEHGDTLVYGGASVGLMNELAQSALDHGAAVIGVMPRFMIDVNKQRNDLNNKNIPEFDKRLKEFCDENGYRYFRTRSPENVEENISLHQICSDLLFDSDLENVSTHLSRFLEISQPDGSYDINEYWDLIWDDVMQYINDEATQDDNIE